MGFQIHKDNQAIAINKLDELVCGVWGQPIRQKQYATPFYQMVVDEDAKKLAQNSEWKKSIREEMAEHIYTTGANWFDYVGYAINRTDGKHDIVTWQHVKEQLSEIQEKTIDELYASEFLKPFMQLIDWFNDNGYKPVYHG